MKNKLLILIFVLGICGFSPQAQTLSPTVISSSGGYFTSANASLSFTVAEMTMVNTFTSTNNILTQGFQQPEDYLVGITETPVFKGEVLIYPNPSNGNFILSYVSNYSSDNIIKLYNLLGQVVFTKTVVQVNGLNTVNFDIRNLNQGIYLLELTLMDLKGEKLASPVGRKTEIHKINLIY